MPKYKTLEEYDEEITRVVYTSIEQMKRHYQTNNRVLFKDNPRVKEVWHIVKSVRK